MKKAGVALLIITAMPLIAGLYGILHDQLTYTICPEYYTKFKFIRFGLGSGDEIILPSPRRGAAVVGFLATWWTGIFIGIPLALVSLIQRDHRQMLRAAGGAVVVALTTAFVTGLIGLAYGKLQLAHTGVDWWLPPRLIDKPNFIAVGSMHNFSYLGGLFGLIIAVVYQFWYRHRAALSAAAKND